MPQPTAADAVRVRAPLGWALACLVAVAATGTAGCGDRGGDPTTGPTGPTAPIAVDDHDGPDLPDRDVFPPRFDGVQRVELLGQGVYRLAWDPAEDDVSPGDTIAYQVLHIVEPWRSPSRDDTPLTSSLPGFDTIDVAIDGPTGRFYVRAVDQAGNASPWGEGLEQRSTRPWVTVPDGDPVARVDDCAPLEPGRVLCVGEDGFVARWDRDHWSQLNAVDGVRLRLHPGPNDLWVWSPWGHLYRAPLSGELEPTPQAFDGGEPDTPLRQFAADHVGLHWWVGATGQTWIGGGGRFLPMTSPLALPDLTACPGLTGVAFGETAAFATCTGGAVYSVGLGEPGLRWLSLTTTTTFEIDAGLRRVVADGDGGARFVFHDAIRTVSVGGWRDELAAGDTVPGAPAGRNVPTRFRDIVRTDFALWAASDIGLLSRVDGAWRMVPGTSGDIAGVVPPTPIEPRGVNTLIHADGSVSRVERGRRTWIVEPPVSGFFAARPIEGGVLALRRGSDQGVWIHDGTSWTRLTAALPAPLEASGVPTAMAASPDGERVVVATVDDGGVPTLWTRTGATFIAQPWRAIPPPPPEPETPEVPEAPAEPEAPELGPDGEPLPPPPPPALAGVLLDDLDPEVAPVPTPEPIRAIAVDDAGRMVAASEHQVWWRISDGWLLVHAFDVELFDVGLDAGESWVARTDADLRRCWRDRCDAEVDNAGWPPTDVVASWHDADGWHVLDERGALHRFTPGEIDPELEDRPRLDQTPAGEWTEIAPAPRDLPAGTLTRRIRAGEVDVFVTDDGGLHTLVDAVWTRQATEPDAASWLAVGDRWAIVTDAGLVTAGDVPSVVRTADEATP